MDAWTVSAAERSRHEQQFAGLAPDAASGMVTGEQARGFFMQSQLPLPTLGKIWALADIDCDGRMDINEFSVACKLISMQLKGHPVPDTLPPPLFALLSPTAGVPVAPPVAAAVSTISASSPVLVQMPAAASTARAVPVGGVAVLPRPPSLPLQDSGVEWAVCQSSRLRFTQLYNQHDRTKCGHLTAAQARNILVQTALPNAVLAQIWSLADVDADGRMTCEEFVLAMHLCEAAKRGDKLPNSLPADLLPPSFRHSHASGVVSPTSGDIPPSVTAVDSPTTAAAAAVAGVSVDEAVTSPLSQFSFEDKRRENYNKGQAELERRRKVLEEQHKREQEERQRKERELLDRQEKLRLDQEQRRQEELQRQLEAQRETELQRDEARAREQEQKEAARREQERRRKEEWENSKRQELENMRQKQQEALLKLKAHNNQLSAQLESTTERVRSLTKNIGETRGGVTEVKSVIDGMRATRDSSMAELTQLKARLRDQNNRLLQANQERAKLDISDKSDPTVGDAAVNEKQQVIEQLRTQVAELEARCEEKEVQTESARVNIDSGRQQLVKLVDSCKQLHAQLVDNQRAVRRLQGVATPAVHGLGSCDAAGGFSQPAWTANFEDSTVSGGVSGDTAWTGVWNSSQQQAVAAAVGVGCSVQQKLPYRALFEFQGRSNDEISFQPGDIVMINPDANPEPNWLEGEINGHVGWLPESYVEPMSTSPTAAAGVDTPDDVFAPVDQAAHTNGTAAQHNGTGDDPAAAVKNNTDSSDAEHQWYCAVYAYSSAEPGDLSFEQGELVLVTERQGEWWTGQLRGLTGIFPSNYVQPASAGDEVAVSATTDGSTVDSGAATQAVRTSDTDQPANTPPRPRIVRAPTIKKRKGEVAVVLSSFEASSGEQLSLTRGQLVMVRKKSATGWWEGEIQTRGKRRQVGWFPATFVKLKTSRRMSLPDVEADPAMPEALCPGDAPAADPAAPKEFVVAQFAYSAQHDDELSFDADAVITIVNKDDMSWWKGELNGFTGLFPSNYVLPQTTAQFSQQEDNCLTEELQQPSSRDTPSQAPATGDHVSSCSDDWSREDDEESQEEEISQSPHNDHDRDHFDHRSGASVENVQRLTAVKELIESEESYLHSISLANEVFRRPLVASGLLSRDESRTLFVNLHELVACSRQLVVALRVRRKMSPAGGHLLIGDIMCQSLPSMQCYVRYCSCQLRASSLLQRKLQLPAFERAVRQCQRRSRSVGLPFASFLLQPMQRITKYPLLIRQILKHTAPHHADRQNLDEALTAAEELCKQMNEAVGAQENSDRLERLQRCVDVSELGERLQFNSMTTMCGPRRLLHFGLLKKMKSGREVVVFAFNDFIMLTTGVRSLAALNQNELEEQFESAKLKLYKKPIFLDGVSVSEPSADSTDKPALCLVISHPCGKQLSLSASSGVARNLWIKHLRAAVENLAQKKQICRKRENSRDAKFSPCGRLLVVVMAANRLVAARDNGRSDPYCELSMARQVHRTAVAANTLNPRWNESAQFLVRDRHEDVLCVSVFDRDHFAPHAFLGRSEVRVCDVLDELKRSGRPGPVMKRLTLLEVKRGEVDLKLDVVVFDSEQQQ